LADPLNRDRTATLVKDFQELQAEIEKGRNTFMYNTHSTIKTEIMD
jgi:hypothetical protein